MLFGNSVLLYTEMAPQIIKRENGLMFNKTASEIGPPTLSK